MSTLFRPTPFSRAFRSLDAFTAEVEETKTAPPTPSATPAPPAPPTPTTAETLIVIEEMPRMDFERRPVRMSSSDNGVFAARPKQTTPCGCIKGACNYELEYELKLLQMKINWLVFIVFMLVCVLFFKR